MTTVSGKTLNILGMSEIVNLHVRLQINSLQDMFASAQSGKLYYESIVAFGEMLGIIVFYLYNVK